MRPVVAIGPPSEPDAPKPPVQARPQAEPLTSKAESVLLARGKDVLQQETLQQRASSSRHWPYVEARRALSRWPGATTRPMPSRRGRRPPRPAPPRLGNGMNAPLNSATLTPSAVSRRCIGRIGPRESGYAFGLVAVLLAHPPSGNTSRLASSISESRNDRVRSGATAAPVSRSEGQPLAAARSQLHRVISRECLPPPVFVRDDRQGISVAEHQAGVA